MTQALGAAEQEKNVEVKVQETMDEAKVEKEAVVNVYMEDRLSIVPAEVSEFPNLLPSKSSIEGHDPSQIQVESCRQS
jgi:hypothetical protein